MSDCISVALFQVTAANPSGTGVLEHATGVLTPGNSVAQLYDDKKRPAFGKDATVYRMQTRHYYVAASQSRPGTNSLWRLSVPAAAPPLSLQGQCLLDWGGAQRWLKSELPAENIRSVVEKMGGHATLFRAADKSAGVFTPLQPALAKIHRNLKQAFDPAGIFNPGRMYPDL